MRLPGLAWCVRKETEWVTAIGSPSTQHSASARKYNLCCFSRVATCYASLRVLWNHVAFRSYESDCVLFERLYLSLSVNTFSNAIEGTQWSIHVCAKLHTYVRALVTNKRLCIQAWRKLGESGLRDLFLTRSYKHKTLLDLHYQNTLLVFSDFFCQ
jgi:hypothetical protein